MLRAKCALMSLKDFEEGTTRWFQSYLWARFSQPSRLVYYRNMAVRDRVHASVANAVMRVMSQTLAAQDPTFSSIDFWERAFSPTHGSDLRPANANRPGEIVGHPAAYSSDRKSVVQGKGGEVGVDQGGRCTTKQ